MNLENVKQLFLMLNVFNPLAATRHRIDMMFQVNNKVRNRNTGRIYKVGVVDSGGALLKELVVKKALSNYDCKDVLNVDWETQPKLDRAAKNWELVSNS